MGLAKRQFYATAPGTPARRLEEQAARAQGLELWEAKPIEAALLGILHANERNDGNGNARPDDERSTG